MSERSEQLINELKKDNSGTTAEKEENKPEAAKEKLSGKYVTAGLAALVLLLLAFFLGMRLIESRSERLTLRPTETTETTKTKQNAQQHTSDPQSGLVNINTAGLDELKTLDGIGEKKARAIIDYRNEYGPFTAIEEITAVEGVGSGIFEKIKDNICVS